MRKVIERPREIVETIEEITCEVTGETLASISRDTGLMIECKAPVVDFYVKLYAPGEKRVISTDAVAMCLPEFEKIVGTERLHELFPHLADAE